MTWLALRMLLGGMLKKLGGLNGASAVAFALFLQIALVRLLFGGKRTQIESLSGNFEHRAPTLIVAECAKKFSPALARPDTPPILSINLAFYISQICKSVVGFIAINVVNFIFRRASGDILPRKPVCEERPPANANCHVSVGAKAAGAGSNRDRPATLAPNKLTSLRIIAQKGSDQFGFGRLSASLWHHETMTDSWGILKNKGATACPVC